jgi:hypothetical protein
MTVTFSRATGSWIYLPDGGAASDRLAFLCPNGPLIIPLASVWAGQGAPAIPGYLLFLVGRPASAAAKIEAYLLRDPAGPQLPPAPATTGLVWMRGATRGGPELAACLPTMLSPASTPVAAQDAAIMAAPGFHPLHAGKDAPILAHGALDALDIGAPPLPAEGLQPPGGAFHGPGARVDLSPGCAGRITFRALGPGGAGGARPMMDVMLDPVSPIASTETYAGASWILADGPGGVHLEPAE